LVKEPTHEGNERMTRRLPYPKCKGVAGRKRAILGAVNGHRDVARVSNEKEKVTKTEEPL